MIYIDPSCQEVEQEEEVREVGGVLYSKMMLVDLVLTHQYIVTDSRTFTHADRVHSHHHNNHVIPSYFIPLANFCLFNPSVKLPQSTAFTVTLHLQILGLLDLDLDQNKAKLQDMCLNIINYHVSGMAASSSPPPVETMTSKIWSR